MSNFPGQGRTLGSSTMTEEQTSSAEQQTATASSANQQKSPAGPKDFTNVERNEDPASFTRSGHSYENNEQTENAKVASGDIGDVPRGASHAYKGNKASGNAKNVQGNMDGDSFEKFMR